MNRKDLLQKIIVDRADAPARKVVYLEGSTDPRVFFALLGVSRPLGDLLDGVLVKGLTSGRGSGANTVRAYVDTAEQGGQKGIFGILDGDGQPLAKLSVDFDPPFPGPVFTWKAYCIENLLVKAGWPPAWGAQPNWVAELVAYAPCAALNRVVVELQRSLNELGLAHYNNPTSDKTLPNAKDVLLRLEKGKNLIATRDVAQMFREELAMIEAAIHNSLDEAHTRINGKWIFNHFAQVKLGKRANTAQEEWCSHVISIGGLAEMKDLWRRILEF